MANDDAKLKFLPRHLQRSQPAMAHKSKRRVTVEDENAGDEESDRRSVFERLGPGASMQRNEKLKSGFDFQDHSIFTHAGKDRSKRETENSPDNLRLKFKGGKDRETKVKSTVVVRGKAGGSEEDSADDSDGWSMDKLEDKKELELEQKRLEIQRALKALEAGEEIGTDNRKSDSSESDSSPERSHKKKKDKASKKKDKKKHKKNLPEKEQTAEKNKEAKRKHESDDDDETPHKKRKKKSKDNKKEVTPTSLVSESAGKQKKSILIKSGKGSLDLYDPASPTSVARAETPSDKQSYSGSPKLKNKSKKKKKKLKGQGELLGKSKKLLSPLKKVLKLKKGSTSVGSSRRSRSISHEVVKRASRSRSSSSSSESSSSDSPVRRKKRFDSSKDGGTKKFPKPIDKRMRERSHRSSSTSSSSSSTSSSSVSHKQKRFKKLTPPADRSLSRAQKSPAVLAARKDVKGNKRNRRGLSADVLSKAKDHVTETRQERQSLDRGREKQRGRKNNQDSNRHNFSQSSRAAADGRLDLKDTRKDNRDPKNRKNEPKASNRKDTRTVGKTEVRKDRIKDRERADSNINKDRDKRGVSLDRDRDERIRRGGQQTQGDRSSRFSQRAGDDSDRRHFDESNRRFPGIESSRVGQFGVDRQRAGSDRGSTRGNDNQGRMVDQAQGRGRDWDERARRDGGDEFRDEWESNRNNRGGGFGALRDDTAREFGVGRDERRTVREDRLSSQVTAGNDSNKPTTITGSDGRDRSQQRGQGYRDDYGGRDAVTEKRDWKQRESSGDVSKRSSKDHDRSSKDDAADLRQGRNSGKHLSDASNKSSDKDKAKNEKKSGSKQSVVMKVVKSESPITRDEPSLASLFSQTDTVVNKKKPSASFGGKKSSKKMEDLKTTDKSKAVVTGRAGPLLRDKKITVPKASDGSDSKPKDMDKDDKALKKEDTVKGNSSGTSSPRNVPKSGQSSHHAQSKSGGRSKTPEGKHGSVRSPSGPLRPSESVKSPAKPSHSPAPSSGREKDRERTKSPTDSRDRRKTVENRRHEKSKTNERSKSKRVRSRSHSCSDSESRRSSHSGGADEKRRRKSSDSESLPAKLDGIDIAAAMLSEDDGQQDVFSDWSDEDPNDIILTSVKVEDLDNNNDFDSIPRNRQSPANLSKFVETRDLRSEPTGRSIAELLPENRPILNTHSYKIVDDTPKDKTFKEKRKRNTEDEGYEEISSDENELDEEGERLNKRTIVSILDIDIAALMPAVKPAISSAPVFQRFKPASLFANIGLSRKFAGDKLYSEVQQTCQKQLEELEALEKATVKDGMHSDNTSNQQASVSKEKCTENVAIGNEEQATPTSGLKQEELNPAIVSSSDEVKPSLTPQKTFLKRTEFAKPVRTPSQPVETKPIFQLYSDTSAYHKLFKAKALERSHLLANFGMFRRALTARKDLEIRRQLCRIDPKYDQSAVYPSGVLDPDNLRVCLQLFRQKKSGVLSLPVVTSTCVS